MSKVLNELNKFNERCKVEYMKKVETHEKIKKNYISKQKVKEELERAEKENEPYEKYNKESRAYWINEGKISLAKKLLEEK